MYKLAFSIVASFSGEHPKLSDYWPCDTTLSDVIRDWPGDTPDPSDPFDSEFAYLAKEGAIPRRVLNVLESSDRDTRFRICRKLQKRFPRDAFLACISDLQVSGIFDRKTTFGFLDAIGAHFDNCGTGGTIGGPLGHWVPDLAFNVESRALISSIRITPILCRVAESGALEPVRAPSDDQWARIKSIFHEHDCYRIARGLAN